MKRITEKIPHHGARYGTAAKDITHSASHLDARNALLASVCNDFLRVVHRIGSENAGEFCLLRASDARTALSKRSLHLDLSSSGALKFDADYDGQTSNRYMMAEVFNQLGRDEIAHVVGVATKVSRVF